MTVPIPPTDGATPAGDRLGEQGGTGPDIEAPLPDLAAMAQAAQSAGEAWNASGAMWADSPQGAGLGGWTLDDPQAADDWPTGMSFPHQGP